MPPGFAAAMKEITRIAMLKIVTLSRSTSASEARK
jgi:hypothetical protein